MGMAAEARVSQFGRYGCFQQEKERNPKAMKIVFLDTSYWGSLTNSNLHSLPVDTDDISVIETQLKENSTGAGFTYQDWFRGRGHEAQVVTANCRRVQLADAQFVSFLARFDVLWKYWQLISRIPLVGRRLHEQTPMAKVLMKQILAGDSQVVFALNPNLLTPRLAKKLRCAGKILVGQIASPLPPDAFFSSYSLMLSAFPPQVEHFRALGIRAEHVPLAIESSRVPSTPRRLEERSIEVSFVGSIGRHHRGSDELLRYVAREVPGFQIYTSSSKSKLKRLGLLQNFAGPAWGPRMMEIYSDSKIVLNRHIGMAKGFAVNFRMYEATAAGAVLLTEEAPNLSDLFAPGQEVETYSKAEVAGDKIKYLLNNLEEAQRVAEAGRQSVLERHLMDYRLEQVENLIEKLFIFGQRHP